MGGEREGAGPLPAGGLGLPLRAPSRSGPRLPSRPPQPHAQVHKSARFLRPPRPFPGRRRRLLCEAARPGPRGCRVPLGAPRPFPRSLLGPEKGGWVVVRAKFPALDSCEITTAHQRLCFAVSPFFLLPDSSLPFPSLLRRPKRQAKPAADEGFWDCSVCTFRNSAEAFKCSICDVRKGTSTRYLRCVTFCYKTFFFFFMLGRGL